MKILETINGKITAVTVVFLVTLLGIYGYQMNEYNKISNTYSARVENIIQICKDASCHYNVQTDSGVFTLAYGVGGINEDKFYQILGQVKIGKTVNVVVQGKEFHPFYFSMAAKVYPSIVDVI